MREGMEILLVLMLLKGGGGGAEGGVNKFMIWHAKLS
jgi:hypothetical protein